MTPEYGFGMLLVGLIGICTGSDRDWETPVRSDL